MVFPYDLRYTSRFSNKLNVKLQSTTGTSCTPDYN